MSVAFRRDSDEEHLEPAFELPIPVGPNLVTERGMRLIAEKVAVAQCAVTDAVDDDARKKLRRILRYWATQHATAQIISPPGNAVAGLGSAVTIRRGAREQRFTIVGHDEAEPKAGLLAFTAPVARAVMGATEGDWIAFGGVEDAIEVIKITP